MLLEHTLGDTPPAGAGLSLFTGDGALTRLSGVAEHWSAADPSLRLIHWYSADTDDIRRCAETAYRSVQAALGGSGHSHLLRTWTYFDRINEGVGDSERYRQFCIGRAAGLGAASGHPAATVIGCTRPGFWLSVIAAKTPGIALENPRQIPAWQYPRAYGPQSPGFARALWRAEEQRLFVSGTSSVVGHETWHAGVARDQLEETFRNLEALLAHSQETVRQPLAPLSLWLYLRRAENAAWALQRCQTWASTARWGVVVGEVCRADLDVEIEGVYVRPAS